MGDFSDLGAVRVDQSPPPLNFDDLGAVKVWTPKQQPRKLDFRDLGAVTVSTAPPDLRPVASHQQQPLPLAAQEMPVSGFENYIPPTEADVDSLVPQAAIPALNLANRYAVQPFERMAQKGAEIGRIGARGGVEVFHPNTTPEETAQQHPYQVGIAQGIGGVIGGMVTDPRNWPFLGSSAARPLLQRLISGGFGVMMGKSSIDTAQTLYEKWDQLTPEQRAEMITQGGLSAAMATMAASHAVRGGELPVTTEHDGTYSTETFDDWVKGQPQPEEPVIDAELHRQVLGRQGTTPSKQLPAPILQAPLVPKPALDFSDLGGTRVSEPLATGREIAGEYGADSAVKTPTADVPARFKLVEAGDLTPSHNPESFVPNPDYPAGVQERAYHTSKEAQTRVIQQAQNYDPRYTVNSNPDAVNGPPIVTPDGIVLGGNSRTMATQRIYARGQGDTYREYLRENAQQFGVSPASVDRFENPVLVREVAAPADVEAARRLGQELNKTPTGALGVSERAVSAGKSITPESLSNISKMLDELGPDSSIRDLLRERGGAVLWLLQRDGAITERERPQFIDTSTGGLSEEGKTFVERALLGTVVSDPVLMDRVPKSVLNKLDSSLSDLASIAPRTDKYNILPLVRDALREHAEIAQHGGNVETYLGQTAMFGEARNPAVDALVRKLAEKPKAVREAFRSFARDASVDTQNQGFLSMMEPPTAEGAFANAFGRGPGAKTAGPSEMYGTALQQLTESLKGKRLSLPTERPGQRVSGALAGMSESASKAWNRVEGTARTAWDSYVKPEAWTEFKDALGKFQGALQKGDWELQNFAKEIKQAVPSKLRREAITNWVQAAGDADLLRQRAEASSAEHAPGYREALKLTPDERTLANNIRTHFDAKLEEAQQAGMLEQGVENFVNQVWARDPNNPAAQRLRAAVAFNELQPNPSFLKKRVFDSYFEGEQAGFKPRDKDIGALVAVYNQSFNNAIASRAFIKSLHDGVAADGRPLVEVAGSGIRLESPPAESAAYFVRPKTKPGEAWDYKTVDHPALRQWKWATKDAEGNPIFLQGDMLVHPEVYGKLKNILGTSAIREYAVGRAALALSSAFKQTLLSLSGFHQVQIGVHSLEHTINPFGAPKLDLNDATQRALVDHGLMVSDFHGMSEFAEGVSGTGLVSKVPILGRKMAEYQDYLFRDFIPRVKMSMATHALDRNIQRYSGELTHDQILELTSKQANAAFGHLNYRMMARNKTLQDSLRLLTLAPDFLEARSRFGAQALKPHGREQLRALALGAVGLAAGKAIIGQLANEEQDWSLNHLFFVKIGGREYGLRTIQGDVIHLLSDPRSFTSNRLNPALTRPLMEAVTGRDQWGRRRDTYQQLEDYFRTAVPIPLKGLVNKGPQDFIETLMQSTGIYGRKYRSQESTTK